jgi:hypothetical protein
MKGGLAAESLPVHGKRDEKGVCCILTATAMNGLFHFSFVFFGFMLLDY